MLTKIRNVDFVSKEIKYHGLCRCRYQKRTESVQNNYNVGRSIQLKVVPSKNLTGTFLGKFTLKFLKPYVVLLTMLLSKRKKYIKLTILIKKFCMNYEKQPILICSKTWEKDQSFRRGWDKNLKGKNKKGKHHFLW